MIKLDPGNNPFNLREEDGWRGCFTREQADGGLPNGTRITKSVFHAGDTFPVGTRGTVLGSIHRGDVYFYFIEWDPFPRVAVGIMEFRIRPVHS